MTQTEGVLQLLRNRPEGITAIDALEAVGSFRWRRAISDLRAEGHHISSTIETTPNGKHVARYRLVEQPQMELAL